ncbi:hypothetical protein MMC31_006637 [Peltigera leucophlebia]|nr:hypothetical protein [Peltigera leucophlebia]
MSPTNICPTSSNASSSNPPDPPNQPAQNPDYQNLAPPGIDTQDTENLIAMASRVSLLSRASEHPFLAMESPEILEFQKTIEGLATLMESRNILEDEDWELAWDGLSNLQVEPRKCFERTLWRKPSRQRDTWKRSATALPSTIKGWEDVASKTLQEANRRKPEELEYEALPSKVRADGQKLVQSRTPTPRNFVH